MSTGANSEKQPLMIDGKVVGDNERPHSNYLSIINAMIVAVPSEISDAQKALADLEAEYGYKAPELHCNIFRDVYDKVIIAHLIKHADADWTERVQEIWRQYNQAAKRKKPPKSATKIC